MTEITFSLPACSFDLRLLLLAHHLEDIPLITQSLEECLPTEPVQRVMVKGVIGHGWDNSQVSGIGMSSEPESPTCGGCHAVPPNKVGIPTLYLAKSQRASPHNSIS
jgi:hypothetical protein